jgi:hypothetical protein
MDYLQSPDLFAVGTVHGVGTLGFGELAPYREIMRSLRDLLWLAWPFTVR